MSAADDAAWMRCAARHAACGAGATAPNPHVGCVIVREGVLLGAGFHRACGAEHAEVAALADGRQRGHDPRGATAYVTLAPCTRHGRTPPCCDALIAAGIKRVVAALADPVQDDAARILGAAGIAYEVADADGLGQHLHGGFLQRVGLGRPRCTGKWAMTLDGHLATRGGHSAWISSPAARALSRRRRRAFDAIVVGAGTALADDPSLLTVPLRDRTPLRVVLSASGRCSDGLANTARQHGVLVIASSAHCAEPTRHRLAAQGVELLLLEDAHDPLAVLTALATRGCNEVLVEGGAALHGAFLAADCYDRLEIYQGARTLAGGHPVSGATGAPRIDVGGAWQIEEPPRLLGDSILHRWRRAAG